MHKVNVLRMLHIVCLLYFYVPSKVSAIDVNSLSAVCEAMESAITDISLEYEWYHIPPYTKEDIAGTGNLITEGADKFSMTTKFPFKEHYLFTRQMVLANEKGDSFESIVKVSYNGERAKRFDSGGLPLDNAPRREYLSGTISKTENDFSSLILTPLGFTILRMQFSVEPICLSEFMRQRGEFVKIGDQSETINGFRTIRADFLTEWKDKKFAFLRVYFSIDNDYTPVRYEYMNGPNSVGGTVDIKSLTEVEKGFWFPASGTISSPDDKRVEGFRLTGKVVVNQGLEDKDFGIEFPPGTRVADEITGKMYTIKPTQQQLDQSLPK
ncbi:MAG: hypothetical protein KJ757_04235 [Planctomycetes bacterium]|nr:hypothetical protein [Planctomycetota bacterium]MBU1518695.1 hypothetical protein [Planctomycetota bacterium]MBU2457927.1 hypothetical protein [Planctomycetota bacterium]MBU2596752.1 hypothetical protein [Planctomycetota bacterium]